MLRTKLIGRITGRQLDAEALLDSGAEGLVLHPRFAAQHNLTLNPLKHPFPVCNVDNSENVMDSYHQEKVQFFVADIGDFDIILGTDWLEEYNPEIDWLARRVDAKAFMFPNRINVWVLIIIFGEEASKWEQGLECANSYRMNSASRYHIFGDLCGLTSTGTYKAVCHGFRDRDSLPTFSVCVTNAQKLAERASGPVKDKSFEELVPAPYRSFQDVFDKSTSERLPEHRPWDHAIDLKPEFEPKSCKVYPLSPNEQIELDSFLDDHLKKGYIRPSKSPMASPFFFVKKKDGKLRPVQDYRQLNKGTVKNEYPLPLISEIVDNLKGTRIFTKMDVRWGYNNVRIKEGDEWKAAFKTNRGLFEPLVMFFGLMNSPATFQAMMNELFKDLIDLGKVIIYMDDILIFTDTIDEHRRLVQQVLQHLHDNDLFLKPEKCSFEQASVEYLGLIVSHDKLSMDPIKVAGIADWPTPCTVKDVQSFLGFGNFYRQFIKDFSKIARPMFDLTKKEQPWDWTPPCQLAFDQLKTAFTSSPVLIMPDPTKPYLVEVDASDFATGGILSQKAEDNLWHPVAYLSKALSDAERNYDIYDKELLAIIRALEAWCHYLEGCPHQIEIWTDHKNLEYFKTAQKLSRCQARWALFLTHFDFTLVHKPGVHHRPDPMSRRPDHREGVENDNMEHVLLDPKFLQLRATRPAMVTSLGNTDLRQRIRNAKTKDIEVINALDTILRNGPRSLVKNLQEWNYEDGIVLFRGKVYVPADPQLHRDIVKMHHDSPQAGHPGRHKTYELVTRNYWWPGMSVFIHDYVDGCATCQSTKNQTHRPHVESVPNAIPTRPFQDITSDFIVDLPICEGFDSVCVVVDRFTKHVTITPCNKTITSDQTVDILIDKIYRHYGLWDRLISDRGPQYAGKVMRGVFDELHIKSALSTAYHPQTDGESERFNQEFEQYLHVFCNYRQDDWV
ncbi:hypothetical protein EVG20_g9269, partial [Dentipellis fragilis]